MILLDYIIEEYKQGKIKIIAKEFYYREGYKRKSYIRKDYYLQYENGETRRLSKKNRKELESI